MLLKEEREQIVEYGKKLIKRGLTKGTGGNLSIFCPSQKLFAISPSGMDYFSIEPEDVVVMDVEGRIAEGSRKPSVEWNLHAIFYKNRQDIKGVVHTHSLGACALAALNQNLPPVSYLVALAGTNFVPCAAYATFGTEELAESVYRTMGKGYAALMANHGLTAVAQNLDRAFYIAEEIEYCCEIYLKAKAAGTPIPLPREEMQRMQDKLGSYGQGQEKRG